ncbi:MAG: translation initiation factor IF-2 [Cyanobacteriota bacterium]|nr:translation initiation factor IF-2 [Cyanobacteriota bacterium]
MNNGKVRIYELSKELNLENKDILAVCDSLNISVKSHSSTITESDAERIRKTAENMPHSAGKSPGNDRGNLQQKDSGSNAGERKKQQILEIRKPKKQKERANNEEQGQNNNTLVATPPQAPVSVKEARSPVKPKLNSPPSPQSDREAVNGVAAEPEAEQQENKNNSSTSRDTSSEKLEKEKVELVGPPPRPTNSTRKQGISLPTLSDRPTPKKKQDAKRKRDKDKGRDKEDDSLSARVNKGTSDKAMPKPVVAESTDALKGKERPRKGKPTVKIKPVPELQRPQPARKPAPVGKVDGEDDLDEDNKELQEPENQDLELELEKPRRKAVSPAKLTPPRVNKRAPKWEDEEEDGEGRLKSAKAAAKSKRLRPKPIDDDDVDLDEDESLEMPAPATVSLSLARPPKPKNNQAPKQKPSPSMPTIAGPDKNKKSKPSRDGSGDSNSQASEPQRPETLVLAESMTVQELAATLLVPETDIIKRLFMKGVAVNITETLDMPTIKSVAEELGVEIETPSEESAAKKTTEMLEEADLENLQRRPPVVTIMGHVDHGKTTLLDSIRSTKVAQGEAGGITQHIGAYHVDVEHNGANQQVVFLDTPGHEAFTAMRARGTRVTDVAILVVAADDGVRPQTKEAISHAKAAGVPLVVAINKIDKEGANPDRVKQELMEQGLVPEEWGGDTIMVPVSAIQGENLDSLLEMILLVSEVEDLQANPNRLAKGTIIEAHLDKARGPVASLLVQNGTLKLGDVVVAGTAYGKVRAMIDDRGDRVEEAGPSFAVEVLGLRDVPKAGDEFDVFEEEKEASAIAGDRVQQARASRLLQGRYSLSALSARAQEGELKELNLILKADVQGSLEAILGSLRQLPQKEVQLSLLLSAPGEITETDIDLAAASGAVIIGFNTTMATGARQAADLAGVDVREYNIIYKLLDDIEGAMEGLLEPELVEEPLGETEVRAVFSISRGAVAGCYVLSGKMIRNCKVRVRRNGEVIHEGILDSLKRMKDDVKEVNAGYECGISLSNFSGWAEGDIIEAYRMATKRRKLSS